MILTEYEKLQKAIDIAFDIHKDQTRYDGSPYIFHPLQVMLNVKSMKAKIVAVLHDTIEDSDFPDVMYWQIHEHIDPDTASIVKILTKLKDEDYDYYIEHVCNNPIAIEVKIADISHNIISLPDDKKYDKRRDKYVKALTRLAMHKAFMK